MKSYQKINLEDHPEYLEFAIQLLTAKEYELVADGLSGEKLDEELQKYKKELGL